MMRNTLATMFYMLLSTAAVCQKPMTGTATAQGTCNIANTGNSASNLVIHCGIGRAQGDKIIELLNRALASKDLATINGKLDELIRIAEQPAPTNNLNCTGSNCVQNGTQTNFDQRQFGVPQPPPQIQDLIQKNIDPIIIDPSKPLMSMEGPQAGNPGVQVTFSVDRIFQIPMFLIKCDRPCAATSASVGGVSAPQMLSTQDATVTGVSLGIQGGLFPGNKVTITVRSLDKEKTNIIFVNSYIPPIQR